MESIIWSATRQIGAIARLVGRAGDTASLKDGANLPIAEVMVVSSPQRHRRQLMSAVGGTFALVLIAAGLTGMGGGLLHFAGWPGLAGEPESRALVLPPLVRTPAVLGRPHHASARQPVVPSREPNATRSRVTARDEGRRVRLEVLVGRGDQSQRRSAPGVAPVDTDGDGLVDAVESRIGTSRVRADSDTDSMPDGWESVHLLDPLDAADADTDVDGDGLTNRTEFRVAASPRTADTNADGRSDARDDRDSDGVPNLVEQRLGIDPAVADSDGDGRPDGDDDPDADGLPTRVEVTVLLDPGRAATDGGAVSDGERDSDGDGVANAAELQAGTNPATPEPAALPRVSDEQAEPDPAPDADPAPDPDPAPAPEPLAADHNPEPDR